MRCLPSLRAIVVSASLLAGASLWELLGRELGATFLAPFSDTMVRAYEMTASGELPRGLLGSLSLFVSGLGLSIALGIPFGLLIARKRTVRIALEGYITMLYAVPMIALIPFILSMFGFGFGPKVLVVVLFAIFPVLYHTVEGARSINPEFIDVAKAFRSREWRLWRDVLLPYSLPYALTGIRQAIGRALVGVIAAEMFLGASGVGALIVTTSQNFDMAGLLATICTITGVGVALMTAGEFLERRFSTWRVVAR